MHTTNFNGNYAQKIVFRKLMHKKKNPKMPIIVVETKNGSKP